MTIRRLIFLSHGETLDLPGEEFTLRGAICKTVPQTKQLSAIFFAFFAKNSFCSELGGWKGISSPGVGRAIAACSRVESQVWEGTLCIIIKN